MSNSINIPLSMQTDDNDLCALYNKVNNANNNNELKKETVNDGKIMDNKELNVSVKNTPNNPPSSAVFFNAFFTKPKDNAPLAVNKPLPPLPKKEPVVEPLPKKEPVVEPLPKKDDVVEPLPKKDDVVEPLPKKDDVSKDDIPEELNLPLHYIAFYNRVKKTHKVDINTCNFIYDLALSDSKSIETKNFELAEKLSISDQKLVDTQKKLLLAEEKLADAERKLLEEKQPPMPVIQETNIPIIQNNDTRITNMKLVRRRYVSHKRKG